MFAGVLSHIMSCLAGAHISTFLILDQLMLNQTTLFTFDLKERNCYSITGLLSYPFPNLSTRSEKNSLRVRVFFFFFFLFSNYCSLLFLLSSLLSNSYRCGSLPCLLDIHNALYKQMSTQHCDFFAGIKDYSKGRDSQHPLAKSWDWIYSFCLFLLVCHFSTNKLLRIKSIRTTSCFIAQLMVHITSYYFFHLRYNKLSLLSLTRWLKSRNH